MCTWSGSACILKPGGATTCNAYVMEEICAMCPECKWSPNPGVPTPAPGPSTPTPAPGPVTPTPAPAPGTCTGSSVTCAPVVCGGHTAKGEADCTAESYCIWLGGSCVGKPSAAAPCTGLPQFMCSAAACPGCTWTST